jgi:hypothetical protein
VCVLRVLGTPAQAQRLAEAHGFVRFTIECGGVQVFASDPREASGAFKSYAQCRDEAQAERSPGRFRCCRCGALHCRCFDLGD